MSFFNHVRQLNFSVLLILISENMLIRNTYFDTDNGFMFIYNCCIFFLLRVDCLILFNVCI